MKNINNVNSWKLWDEDIDKFKRLIGQEMMKGNVKSVSYTDEIIVPETAETNAGRRFLLALAISTNEAWEMLRDELCK